MKVYKYFIIVIIIFLPFFMSCNEKKSPDVDKKIESLKNRINLLSKRVASIEERLYKSAKNKNVEVGKTTQPVKKQPVRKKSFAKKDSVKFPSEFDYPQYDLKVTGFKCYKGTGNIAAYYGNVITEKDIQMLNLSISFFDINGKKIGGHVFPVKFIFAKEPTLFQNGDIVKGGFDKIATIKLEVDFLSSPNFRLKGQAVEPPKI